ncbi:MAG TPA: hypothetical protein VK731_03500 [Candidatus Cybelea sp.]|nr:hypothetical protein [Candidatus Cybelea sp.]
MTMTFSIICQYVTNTFTTNYSPLVITEHTNVETVLLNSANLVKAMAIDLFGTKWTNWAPATIVYEQNQNTGNEGIFLRYLGKQTNVSPFFTNLLSGYGYSNTFSADVPLVFNGNNLATNATGSTILPLTGRVTIQNPPVTANLAYLTFSSSNTSFTLFGYSQGSLLNTIYDKEGDTALVNKAMIVGAGTFNLNVTTNFLLVTNSTAVVPKYYGGVAHGTVYMAIPYHLNIDASDGGP